MNKTIIHVAMAGDRNILLGMAVAGRSALEMASAPIMFEILGSGFTEEDKSNLVLSWQHENNAGINFHNIETDSINKYRSTLYLKSKSAYSRYYVGLIKNAKRVIYIDTDVIILRDLREAAEMNLEGCSIAAVRDISVRLKPDQSRIKETLGIPNSSDYFNSGFLIIDMEKWRKNNSEEKLCSISISMFDKLDCQDQDALNIVFHKDVKLLDVSWNTSQYEVPVDVGQIILHLIGTIKPWHSDYNHHFANLFNYWIDKTAYAGSRPADSRNLSARLERFRRRMPTADMLLNKAKRLIRVRTH